MLNTEIVYPPYDNTIERVLWADGAAPSLSTVTLMELDLGGGVTLDSATNPEVFDWSQTVTAAQAALPSARALGVQPGDPKLVLKLGQAGLTAGTYHASLIVYDPGNPHGILWDRMRIVVK